MVTRTELEFFLGAPLDVVLYETIEMAHPSFSKTYYVVRNNGLGIVATLETGEEVEFEYYPLRVSLPDYTNNLQQDINIQVGDLGEVIPMELDRIVADGTFSIKPTLVYRAYASDDLTGPVRGPFSFEVNAFAFTDQGAAFTAQAPSTNLNGTGLVYNATDIPMLKGV